MLKETITYTDFNGKTITEDFYFNMSKSELIEFENSVDGGLSSTLNDLPTSEDEMTFEAQKKSFNTFKELILRSYGKKSEDGKFFRKSEELSNDFYHSAAYEELFNKLIDPEQNYAATFVNALMPSDLVARMAN